MDHKIKMLKVFMHTMSFLELDLIFNHKIIALYNILEKILTNEVKVNIKVIIHQELNHKKHLLYKKR